MRLANPKKARSLVRAPVIGVQEVIPGDALELIVELPSDPPQPRNDATVALLTPPEADSFVLEREEAERHLRESALHRDNPRVRGAHLLQRPRGRVHGRRCELDDELQDRDR